MINRKRILFEDIDEGPQWVVTYHFGNNEFDDNMSETSIEEIILNATDFDAAVKYAQQYLRKMQTEEETKEQWQDAQILAVELR